jgi:hypothetical protein
LFHVALEISTKGKNGFELFTALKGRIMIYLVMRYYVLWVVVVTASEEHIAFIFRIGVEEYVPPEC